MLRSAKTRYDSGALTLQLNNGVKMSGGRKGKPTAASFNDIENRFTIKYKVDTQGCWIWTGSTLKSGYGLFTDENRKTVTAHRWAFRHFKGEIPTGAVIDHICRVKSCVNPRHLQATTQSHNIKRSLFAKRRSAATHCKNGHEYTAENTKYMPNRRGRVCRACLRKG